MCAFKSIQAVTPLSRQPNPVGTFGETTRRAKLLDIPGQRFKSLTE